MLTIETTVEVDELGNLRLVAKTKLPPGMHEAVLIIEDQIELEAPTNLAWKDWPTIEGGVWPAGLSLRREDLYGDDAR